uniref:Uncharacterized protein n=1 Tax=Arundo donax TaxID=35708 RepID=A0A0A8Y9B7_ARUDO
MRNETLVVSSVRATYRIRNPGCLQLVLLHFQRKKKGGN